MNIYKKAKTSFCIVLSVPVVIIIIVLAVIAGIIFSILTRLEKRRFRKLERRRKLRDLWSEYELRIADFHIWRHENADMPICDPDAQTLLLRAIGPLNAYHMYATDRRDRNKAWVLLAEHLSRVKEGGKAPSQLDYPHFKSSTVSR